MGMEEYIGKYEESNAKVKVRKKKVIPLDEIRGSKFIPALKANIFLCAKKESGKTSAIDTLISECTDKYTNVIIFSSTIDVDETYKEMIEELEDRGNPVFAFTHFIDDDTKVNYIDGLLKYLQQRAEKEVLKKKLEKQQKDDDDDDNEIENLPVIKTTDTFDTDEESEDGEVKRRKPKLKTVEFLIIFDDMNDLRHKSIYNLLRKHRHFDIKVIISSQNFHDLDKKARLQIDYLLIWGGLPDDKLDAIYDDATLSIPEKEFQRLYHDATAEKYNFLYIDRGKGIYKHNFNKPYITQQQANKISHSSI